MAEKLDRPETEYNLDYREKTERMMSENHELEGKDHDPELNVHLPELGDMTCDITVECEECGSKKVEVYVLRYVERHSDGERFRRDEPPKCNCEAIEENGQYFQTVSHEKVGEDVVNSTGRCGWCGTTFTDKYKWQHYQQI